MKMTFRWFGNNDTVRLQDIVQIPVVKGIVGTLEGKADNINAGSNIAIKGICTGYNFDADMGIPGDVILTRCFIVK